MPVKSFNPWQSSVSSSDNMVCLLDDEGHKQKKNIFDV